MFTQTDWEQTQFYKDIQQKTKLDSIPKFLQLGLTLEQIAYAFELDIEIVRKAFQEKGFS